MTQIVNLPAALLAGDQISGHRDTEKKPLFPQPEIDQMRSVVYAVAAIAAVGIMVGIATMPDSAEQTTSTEPATVVSAEVMDDAGTLTMAVPKMHCEFACFPKVKETLESLDGVEEVVLDEQQSDTVLDNRQVVVTYEPGFNVTDAIAKLAERGYADSDVVQ